MIAYHSGQWNEDKSMPDEYGYSHREGLTYAGYDPTPIWQLGIEDLFQVLIHWASDETFDSAPYRYFVHVVTFAFGDGFLVKDFPDLLQVLKELTPLIQDAREQELHEMREEEHQCWAKDRKRERGKNDFCSHL